MTKDIVEIKDFRRPVDAEQQRRNRKGLPGVGSEVCGSNGSRADELDGRIKVPEAVREAQLPEVSISGIPPPKQAVKVETDGKAEIETARRCIEECAALIRKDMGSNYRPLRGIEEHVATILKHLKRD